jgi:glycosyltransferase involved in cell wall biosynthesis
MKFSVLLPTRNRLELLRLAVETVRLQDDADWEIVISDNASQEDVRGYVEGLADARIVYVRSDVSIPVTDNWNLALSHCTGDYIVMLGDDDGLLPGYFSRARHLIEKHKNPEVLYTGALLYAYPGVMPGVPDGFLRSYEERSIYRGQKEPFLLSNEDARRYVDASLDFRVEFDYNMQFFLVNRAAVKRLQAHGDFYQSPYPDYYAANALLRFHPRCW